ncbi:hypothetical protein [Sphingobium boeckii]|uniref:Uncharacterized protein n=1 Tax=Sphingobium boeckii TaxID=1082345 RepID=A0A7W9EFF2_9SPHN|nr:hypothetical protein [Sphingobium boeckii]MBB5687197.1 hypothetical protein [Sphingobium boeckii]
MVMTTPNKIIDFPENAAGDSVIGSWRSKGREYLDATFTAAQENPWRTAAIGAGVVATVAATAYGASVIAHRIGAQDDADSPDDLATSIDPQSLPEAVRLD